MFSRTKGGRRVIHPKALVAGGDRDCLFSIVRFAVQHATRAVREAAPSTRVIHGPDARKTKDACRPKACIVSMSRPSTPFPVQWCRFLQSPAIPPASLVRPLVCVWGGRVSTPSQQGSVELRAGHAAQLWYMEGRAKVRPHSTAITLNP